MSPCRHPRVRSILIAGLIVSLATIALAPAAAAVSGPAAADSGAPSRPAGDATSTGPQAPTSLKVEYLESPMGIDMAKPRFFWVPNHTERGQRQTAYRIIVTTDPAALKRTAESDALIGVRDNRAAGSALAWDSGKVAATSSIQIPYDGAPLGSGTTYYWQVRFWDAQDRPSPWSAVARFDTGLLSPADWTGIWIGGKNQLRKEFALAARVRRARAYVSGLGYNELRINGRKVGGAVLDPAWTTYDKRALYTVHDVTAFLRPGDNAVAVSLGQGWLKSRALLFQMRILLDDGAEVSVAGDGSWKSADGPIVEDSIYDGETYDARRETPGWDRPGFDDSQWAPAAVVDAPGGALSAQLMPPIRVVDTIVPLRMTSPRPGIYVFDMGQNFSGWVRLRVRGPRGADVRLRFAELLYDDGTINTETIRAARAEDHYILKGGGEEEVWEPRFTYHGFRYVEVAGWPGTPALDAIRGRVVHSAVPTAGSFTASKDILNRLQRIIVWGQKTNLHGIPTDCSQRDERMGWLGDAQGTAEEAMMNFDMAAFFTNFIRDIRDVQDEQGRITDTVPHVWGSRPADPAWGTAYPLLCWYMYRYYGDTRILEEHYEGLAKYFAFLKSRAENGLLLTFSHYGDWVAVEKCPGAIVSSFYYYYDAKIMADVARVLGKTADARAYDELAGRIRTAFHAEYYNPETGDYADGTQTANTLPLFLDLAPDDVRGRVWGRLFDNIVYRNDSHLTTGIIGTKYIMELLSRSGASDLAYDIACKTDYPSWGYMIENGATTLWELWQKREGPSMNSHNHPMFGSVGAWLYKILAGLTMAPETTAFERIVIAPHMVRDLRHASGTVATIRGDVGCTWSRGDKTVRLEAVVPVGSSAEIVIPKFNWRDVTVTESGRPVWADGAVVAGVEGIDGAEDKDGALRFRAGSGLYVFELRGK